MRESGRAARSFASFCNFFFLGKKKFIKPRFGEENGFYAQTVVRWRFWNADSPLSVATDKRSFSVAPAPPWGRLTGRFAPGGRSMVAPTVWKWILREDGGLCGNGFHALSSTRYAGAPSRREPFGTPRTSSPTMGMDFVRRRFCRRR